MFNYKFFINCLCTSVTKLKKDYLIYCTEYMVNCLSLVGFSFKYLKLLGIDYNNCSSLSIKNLRHLFDYCRYQYLSMFLGIVTKISKDSN